jgi:muconolactone delta-isomerase
MKFLSIHRFKDSYFILPPEKRAELAMSAFAVADKYLKNGKIKMSWAFSDRKGIASIVDVESSEELMRILAESPLTPYQEGEMIPIVEYEAATKIVKEMMATAHKAAKK